jgi:hypothetical protein
MIPALIVLAFFTAVIVMIKLRSFRENREAGESSENLRDVAERLKVKPKIDEHVLTFNRGGFPAAISIHPGARLNVEVSFQLTGHDPGWLSVSSLGFKRAFLESFGFRDIQVGETAFDERFEIWGRDEYYVGRKLTAPLRELLNQMDRRWDFLAQFTPERLSVRARLEDIDSYQIESIAGVAFQFLDLLDLKVPGEVIVAVVQEKLGEDTRCPVCGTPLSKGSIVRCAKCRSAHHADCWQFNGLCATFACGSQMRG